MAISVQSSQFHVDMFFNDNDGYFEFSFDKKNCTYNVTQAKQKRLNKANAKATLLKIRDIIKSMTLNGTDSTSIQNLTLMTEAINKRVNSKITQKTGLQKLFARLYEKVFHHGIFSYSEEINNLQTTIIKNLKELEKKHLEKKQLSNHS